MATDEQTKKARREWLKTITITVLITGIVAFGTGFWVSTRLSANTTSAVNSALQSAK